MKRCILGIEGKTKREKVSKRLTDDRRLTTDSPLMSARHIKKALSLIFKKYKDKVVFAYLFGSAAQDKMYP